MWEQNLKKHSSRMGTKKRDEYSASAVQNIPNILLLKISSSATLTPRFPLIFLSKGANGIILKKYKAYNQPIATEMAER